MRRIFSVLYSFLFIYATFSNVGFCLFTQAALADDVGPETSQITKSFLVKPDVESSEIDLAGFQRPDIIGYIYAGRYNFIAGNALDNLRYFAYAYRDLSNQCPNLKLDNHKLEITPYLLSATIDLVKRFQKDQLSPSELGQMIWAGLMSGTDPQNTILPSPSAIFDVKLFLLKHPCKSQETERLGNNIISFAEQAPAVSSFTRDMPAPDTQAGRDYVDIYENCSRSSLGPEMQQWCGCYVRTLNGLAPANSVLDALSKNPFVDGRSYMTWLVDHVKGGNALFACADEVPNLYRLRQGRAPRPTACLIDKSADANSCTYRSAWGEFSIKGAECDSEISSKKWGWQEVSCARGGEITTASSAPRDWVRGKIRMIDYEQDVAADFSAPIPPNATETWPVYIRFLKRTAPGELKQVGLTKVSPGDFDLPGSLMFGNPSVQQSFATLFHQKSFILTCSYASFGRGFHNVLYWYKEAPQAVKDGGIAPELKPYMAEVKDPVESCPLQQGG